MVNCTFCGVNIPKGKGTMYVQKDGKILNFCSNKCEKNLITLKRKPRNITWTNEYQQVKKGVKQ